MRAGASLRVPNLKTKGVNLKGSSIAFREEELFNP